MYRHSFVTRATHAVFFLAFVGLVFTGAPMYLHQHWLPWNPAKLHQYFGLTMIVTGTIYIAGGFSAGA